MGNDDKRLKSKTFERTKEYWKNRVVMSKSNYKQER